MPSDPVSAPVSDPFRIEGPAVISFSGGRTSGYMLRRILDAGLQPDVHVLFANTGKERPETLDFVHACQTAWDVPIHWLEFDLVAGVREVTYETASRDGRPFAELINKRKLHLPNPVQRWCTQELKIRPIRDWQRAHGYDHWLNVVGIRADEPRRVTRMRAPTTERWENCIPLADAGVTVADVNAFWLNQPFTLKLRQDEGNCDLCFLKGARKRQNIIRERPDLAVWWIAQEERTGRPFCRDTPSYASMASQGDLFQTEDAIECFCTD